MVGSNVPWRDIGGGPTRLNPRPGGMQFAIEGAATPASGDRPQARGRAVSPGFFSALRIPLLAGREFTDDDTAGGERVVIISASIARTMFPGQDAINRQFRWSDPVAKLVNFSEEPRRIVGVVADLDDEQVDPRAPMTVYHPFEQELQGGRVFVTTQSTNPYTLVPQIERSVRELSSNQPVEQAATLDDIRARVLSPARVNTIVLSVFAGVAMLISVIGIGAVLAFSVSGRRREFGVRLAIGAPPMQLLLGVLRQGLVMAAAGIACGGFIGWALSTLAGAYVTGLEFPGALALAGAAALLVAATVVAALVPAIRAGPHGSDARPESGVGDIVQCGESEADSLYLFCTRVLTRRHLKNRNGTARPTLSMLARLGNRACWPSGGATCLKTLIESVHVSG